jgi:MFS family permease
MEVNVLDAFLTGAYTLAIPLLLLERKVDVAVIGVVFAAMPLTFMMSRTLFASLADRIGHGKIFNASALSSLATVVSYALSSSPISYGFAKSMQGVKDASLWAVNRNAAYTIAGHENPYVITTIDFVRGLAIASGAFVSGFLISEIGFQGLFVVLAITSALMFIPSRRLSSVSNTQPAQGNLLKNFNPRSVDRRIRLASLIMASYMGGSALVIGYILPILLETRGLGYFEIGMTLAIYSGIGAVLLPLTFRRTASIRKVITAQLLFYIPAAILVPLFSGWLMLILIGMMALGESTSYIIMESLITQAVSGQNTATNIAFLFIPGNIATFAAYVVAGLLVVAFGYMAPFWIAGLLFIIYSFSAMHALKCYDYRLPERLIQA